MDTKINLSQLTDLFIQASDLNKNLSEQFVRSFFEIISENVMKGETVKIKGFGTFKLIQMDSRESINVNTGERIVIEGHHKISFLPDATLKDAINKPFAAFEVVDLNDQQVAALEKQSDKEVLTESHKDNEVSEEKVSADKKNIKSKKKNQQKNVDLRSSKNEVKKSTKKLLGLKISLYFSSVLLVLFLAIYILWPLNLLKFLRIFDVTPVEKQLVVGPNEINSLNTLSDSISDGTVDIKDDTVGLKEVIDESIVSKKTESKTFYLIASDEKKDLSLFTISDTVNYRMKETKAEHILQSGETLTMIALKYYGTKKLWPYIAAYNNVKNFNTLKPRTIILVPALENK